MDRLAHGGAVLLAALKSREQTIAFCESLTAGLAAATLAGIPGASAVLRGGLVTYATDLKVSLAGVPQELIDTFGVVSPECAAAMAGGAREVCGTDWALGLTGVAGPDTQEGKPVGEVWIGIAGPGGLVDASPAFTPELRMKLVELGRGAIRDYAVSQSFSLLLGHLDEH
ncbi:CinA family protein [Corynebacterium pacaense]|uniref:CinA family protein n=1 Tax=Corynebacterium pacaense TaxID=1816684 RepID=UPI0009BB6496|nr:CinA family protein [Corynebacterium pacaense]